VSANGTIWNLQVLRFVAAFLVLAAHAVDLSIDAAGRPSWLAQGPENFGAVGVDIFFVISGFIITHVGFGSGMRSWQDFGLGRLRRVLPLYYLQSIPFVLFAWASGQVSFDRIFTSLTLFPEVAGHYAAPYLGPAWTLCFEMLFYAAVGMVLFTRTAKTAGVLLGLYACLLVCCLLTPGTAGIVHFIGNPIILEFLFGVTIALCWRRIDPRLGLPAVGVGGAALVVSMIVGYGEISEVGQIVVGDLALPRVLIWGVPCALVVFGATVGRPWGREGALFRSAIWLGGASYSIYLAHPIALVVLEGVLPAPAPLSFALTFVLAVAVGLAAGAVSHVALERPLLRAISPMRRERLRAA
jgi:exopolysaccharide production protein ExoZ